MKLRNEVWFLAVLLAINLVLAGAGMAVPIFNIAFGFLVGLLVVRKVSSRGGSRDDTARMAWLIGLILAASTFVIMAAIWIPQGWVLLSPHADLSKLGIPQILYSPRASLIGWLTLMIVISPFLQLMSVGFSVFIAQVFTSRKAVGPGGISRAGC